MMVFEQLLLIMAVVVSMVGTMVSYRIFKKTGMVFYRDMEFICLGLIMCIASMTISFGMYASVILLSLACSMAFCRVKDI